MDTNMFQSDDSRKYYCPVLGLKVFVQDSNLRCLTAVSNILQALGYEVMTANNSIELFESELHLQKPVKISNLSSLWKYALWRMEDKMVITADVEGFGRLESEEIIANNNRECQSFMNTGGQTLQSVIIREHNHTRGGKESESLILDRKRLSRTYDSPMKFFGGAELAGTSASPSQTNQLRAVPRFEIQNIESHFQQYLGQANPIQQHNNINSSDLNMKSQHLSQTMNDSRKMHQLQNHHVDICDCMHKHSQSNPLHDFLNSSDQTSNFGKNKFCLHNEPYGVSRYTSDSGESMNNVSGGQRPENAIDGKVISEDTCIYCVDDISVQSEMEFNTLSSNDMCHQFSPSLPDPLLPSEGKHGIYDAKADEILYPPNGTQEFSDEDVNTCLSMYNNP
ncbi:uncharacterized protein LOC114165931 [Vigna unguiculata]|uniref:uncharacterized protein LOC114165931 n=1 Tax=Vigna unguiculata TaxID=3917 RepID=UPI001016CB52|nr:uncharacterized protein LOC114165931 [Vigna unguiculata]XP_027906362.1 uncharacterized protein LOC114165931 [Vigna unguiculata]XP_027906363.1 uncharacterized protein LOC114165931 [Vigna unguiculata]XP_027906364.1 uncharacterized protein LOC114165931 [Vigna unguiculata]XP_027906365.1 uncharacterized protein LOC114165931 [Vigna unguiculata]XP_027906366.1 uncharacterized protein LOC114165931 [Vigna unguiculata]